MKHVNLTDEIQEILTNRPYPPNKVPMFFEKKAYQGASGRIYPIPYTDRLSKKQTMEKYRMVTLENDYIKVQMMPELGGRIQSAYDKKNNYPFVYHNHVIKPAMIGLCGPWISGGIEFNWPQHHRPTTYMPVSCRTEEHADGSKTVWLGETEPLYRQRGMIGITLYPDKSYIKATIRLYNSTNVPQSFMWWSNMAVHINDDYQVVFPPDVEYACFHDRRDFISYPELKGVFRVDLPYDYGEKTDGSWLRNIKLQTSFMLANGGSDMDFLEGYDHQRGAGTIHVADHHIVPGKKLFTWGTGDFGKTWQANLTDHDGPYCELMTGAFTDNQPDFAWIMPYETKEFEEYWYPVQKIGAVKNATKDAAVSLEYQDGRTTVGLNVTGLQPGAVLTLEKNGAPIWERTLDLEPAVPYLETMDLPEGEPDALSLKSKDGAVLVSYVSPIKGKKEKPAHRRPAQLPKDLSSVDELYVNGLHLEQYKHPTLEPADYYLEGLRRDPGDLRCNQAMGRLCLKNGDFQAALTYLKQAETRILSRNPNPPDTEVFYDLGLVHKLLGNTKEAYDYFQKAIWHYGFRSAAYYEIAKLDLAQGNPGAALTHIDTALTTNCLASHLLVLKAILLRKFGSPSEAECLLRSMIEKDCLDLCAKAELFLLTGEKQPLEEEFSLTGHNPEYMLDAAAVYLDCGLYEDAICLLQLCENAAMPLYYMGYSYQKRKAMEQALSCYQKAERCSPDYCFPCRLTSIAVLEAAIEANPQCAKACYYLGNLFYDKFQYDRAIALWEQSAALDAAFYIVHRNLGVAYMEKKADAAKAQKELETAFSLEQDSRVLFELQQLYKRLGISPEEQRRLLLAHADLVDQRDDLYQELIYTDTLVRDYASAKTLLQNRKFNVAEGGEGALIGHHAWLYTTTANHLARQGDMQKALEDYETAVTYPANYSEGRNYTTNESHVYYFKGVALEQAGKSEQAMTAFTNAAKHINRLTELTYYEGLALQKLGKQRQAQELFQAMVDEGDRLIAHAAEYDYYGVGMLISPVFENDNTRNHTLKGLFLQWMGHKGLGHSEKAEDALGQLRLLTPNNKTVFLITTNASFEGTN